MKHQMIRRIFRHLNKKVNQALEAMYTDHTAEQVHDFRVQVKKMRAFLHLLSSAQHHRSRYKLPKDLKNIYTLAGRIRTYQLQLEITGTQPGLVAYTTDLQAHLLRLQAIGNMYSANVKKVHRGLRRLEAKLPQSISHPAMEHFFAHCLQPLQSVDIPSHSLHPLRQGLKDLQYNIGLLQQYLPANKQPTMPAAPEALGHYTDLLGQYLDSKIHVQMMRSDENIYPPASDTRQAIKQLEKLWLTQQHQLRKQINIPILIAKQYPDKQQAPGDQRTFAGSVPEKATSLTATGENVAS